MRHTLVLGFLVASAIGRVASASPADGIAAPAAVAALSQSIQRFVQVDERLYRGEEPTADELAALKELGVRTVISFRTDTAARARVEALGMRFVHIPIRLRPLTLGVSLNQQAIDEFFRIVDDPASGIVYMHCRRGADRTGTFVGLYRIARQHWTASQAYREARRLGMRWWLFRVKNRFERFAATVKPASAD